MKTAETDRPWRSIHGRYDDRSGDPVLEGWWCRHSDIGRHQQYAEALIRQYAPDAVETEQP